MSLFMKQLKSMCDAEAAQRGAVGPQFQGAPHLGLQAEERGPRTPRTSRHSLSVGAGQDTSAEGKTRL